MTEQSYHKALSWKLQFTSSSWHRLRTWSKFKSKGLHIWSKNCCHSTLNSTVRSKNGSGSGLCPHRRRSLTYIVFLPWKSQRFSRTTGRVPPFWDEPTLPPHHHLRCAAHSIIFKAIVRCAMCTLPLGPVQSPDLQRRLTKPPRLTHGFHTLRLNKPRSKYHRIHLEVQNHRQNPQLPLQLLPSFHRLLELQPPDLYVLAYWNIACNISVILAQWDRWKEINFTSMDVIGICSTCFQFVIDNVRGFASLQCSSSAAFLFFQIHYCLVQQLVCKV